MLKSFKTKKKAQISFENDAFKLAEQMQLEEEAIEEEEEELYFDQMTLAEQADFEKGILDKEKEDGDEDTVTLAVPDMPSGSQPKNKLTTRDSVLDAAYDSDDEDNNDSDGLDTVVTCWRRAPDSILLVPDDGVQQGYTLETFLAMESAMDPRASKGQKSSLSKWTKRRQPRKSDAVSPYSGAVRAEDMRMTADQRVAIMTMVRDNAMTVDEAVEFVIDQEAKLATARARKAAANDDTATAEMEAADKVNPLAELIDLMDKLTMEQLTQQERFNIMRDVRDGKKDIRVAIRTVKAIKRRSMHEQRPPRPERPALLTVPKRPARPSLPSTPVPSSVSPAPSPADSGGPARPPRRPRPPTVVEPPAASSTSPAAASAAAPVPAPTRPLRPDQKAATLPRRRPSRPRLASHSDERSGTESPASTSTPPTGLLESGGGGVGHAATDAGTDDAAAVESAGVGGKAGMTDAEREARYAAMQSPAEDDERAGKSKIWKALNPQKLWDETTSSGGAADGEEVKDVEVEDAVEDAQAALDAVQAIDDTVGVGFAELSGSEDEEDDAEDDEETDVIGDDELVAMIEAKRKEREVQASQRAADLRAKHEKETAEEEARLEAERAKIAEAKAADQAKIDAEKGKIHEEAQGRLENELKFDFKFKRKSTASLTSPPPP